MAKTLTYTTTTIELPDAMLWADEFSWPQIEQKKTYSVTGALLVESALKKAGRSIELQADEQRAWVLRSTLVALRALAELPGAVMELSLQGETYAVLFDHEAGAIASRPVHVYTEPDDDDWYVVTLRFIVVPTT